MKLFRSKKMIALMIVLGVITLVILWFIQPYSPLKRSFYKQITSLIQEEKTADGTFSLNDIKELPKPVQNYFIYCGYIGAPKSSYLKLTFKDVPFSLGVNKPTLNIDYTQYNFVDGAKRFAFIDSSIFGLPFQGVDSFVDYKGGMKGVIGKALTLFNQTGPDMDKGGLVTFLSESLFLPGAALQNYIQWEAIDDTHAKATITLNDITASGIFTFNEKGELLNFTTYDRANVDFSGNKQMVKWSAVLSDYKESNGIMFPMDFKAVWHFDEGDLAYFIGQVETFEQH